MKHKNGFTLIELLAVIVILSVILIIAVPSVLKVINDSKDNTFMTSYDNLVDSVKNNIIQRKINKNITVTCIDDENENKSECKKIYEYDVNEYLFYVIDPGDWYEGFNYGYFVFLEGKENGKFSNIDLSKYNKMLESKGIIRMDHNGNEKNNALFSIISKNGKVLKSNDIKEKLNFIK